MESTDKPTKWYEKLFATLGIITALSILWYSVYYSIPKNYKELTITVTGTPTGSSWIRGIGKTRIYFNEIPAIDVDNYDFKIITGKRVELTLFRYGYDNKPTTTTITSIKIVEEQK